MENIFTIYVPYQQIFHEVKPVNVKVLLQDIPQDVALDFLSMLNSLLYLSNNVEEINSKIFGILGPKAVLYLNRIRNFEYSLNGAKGLIFTNIVTLDVIRYVLLNQPKRNFTVNNTPDIIERLIKAYSCIGDSLAYKDGYVGLIPDPPIEYKDLFYQYYSWPLLLLSDYTNQERPTHFFQQLKTFSLIKYLISHNSFSIYVGNYLNYRKFSNVQELYNQYINLLGIVLRSMQANFAKNQLVDIAWKIGIHERKAIFDLLTLDVDEFKSNPEKQLDFAGLREAPLYKYKDNIYFVLSWPFVDNFLELAFLKDFFRHSGISKLYKDFFPTFKSDLYSKIIIEGIIFKRTIEYIFENRRVEAYFENSTKNGRIDYYVRDKDTVYLFEMKDYLLPSKVILSNDFDVIKNHIDTRFIRAGKKASGIGQLIKQIEDLYLSNITNDKLYYQSKDLINIKIVPIVVYTHNAYSLPGLNSYLQNEFLKLIDGSTIKEYKSSILPVTLIRLEDIVAHFDFFKENSLVELVASYHKTMTDSYSQYDSIKENYPYKIDKVNLQAKAQQSFTDFYKKSMLDSVARYNTISKYEMFEDFVLKEISNKM